MGARELRAALFMVAGALIASALGGVVWGVLAPTERLLVVEPGRGATLTGESLHRFDSVAIFVLIGAVTGLLSAAAAWRWRSARGPVLQGGLLIGSGLGALLMAQLGTQVAQWQHPRPVDPPVGQIVELAAQMDTWLALIVQPLIASLVMLFLAALSPSEDLGAGRAGLGSGSAPPEFGGYPNPLLYGGYEPAGEAGSGGVSGSR